MPVLFAFAQGLFIFVGGIIVAVAAFALLIVAVLGIAALVSRFFHWVLD